MSRKTKSSASVRTDASEEKKEQSVTANFFLMMLFARGQVLRRADPSTVMLLGKAVLADFWCGSAQQTCMTRKTFAAHQNSRCWLAIFSQSRVTMYTHHESVVVSMIRKHCFPDELDTELPPLQHHTTP